MRILTLQLRFSLPLLCISAFFLSSCAPPPTGSSAALKQQLTQLQQQQRQQADQLEALQQQLGLLRQQLTGQDVSSQRVQPVTESTAPALPPVTSLNIPQMPATANEEISELADSASSYLSAFSSLATGRYAQAEAEFNQFLSAYPGHQYMANARYWLASSQLSQGKLQAAATNLRQIVLDMSGQERAPAALVLLARVYRQQQQDQEADEILEQLQKRYPESAEAQQFYRGEQSQQ